MTICFFTLIVGVNNIKNVNYKFQIHSSRVDLINNTDDDNTTLHTLITQIFKQFKQTNKRINYFFF